MKNFNRNALLIFSLLSIGLMGVFGLSGCSDHGNKSTDLDRDLDVAVCGDGVCQEGETSIVCPGDCQPVCGDGLCNGDETTSICPGDCPVSCGDGLCNEDETAATCAADCVPAIPDARIVSGDGKITLTWNTVPGAASYVVLMNGETETPVTETSFEATGLTNGNDYDFQVKSVNAAGASEYSHALHAVPAFELGWKIEGVGVQSIVPRGLRVSWTLPSEEQRNGVTCYVISYKISEDEPEASTLFQQVSNINFAQVDSNVDLIVGTRYFVNVVAKDNCRAAEQSTAPSETVSDTPKFASNYIKRLGDTETEAIDFGSSVAISKDNVIVVGAYGNAYRYIKNPAENNWTGASMLDTSIVTNSAFGYSVDIDDTRAVVGAPFDNTGGNYLGAVYLYTKNASGVWDIAPRKIELSEENNICGCSVAISGNLIAVGCPWDVESTGRVYLKFVHSGTLVQITSELLSNATVSPLTLTDGDQFGASVDISSTAEGTYIIVGSPNANEGQGRVDLFVLNGAFFLYHYVRDGSYTNSHFGKSVSIYGNRFVVGEPDNGTGKAYVYNFKDGMITLEEELSQIEDSTSTPDLATGDSFGAAVKIRKDTIIVGAPNKDLQSVIGHRTVVVQNVGAAFVFSRPSENNWQYLQKLTPALPGSSQDRFGGAVDINDDYAVVGANGEGGGNLREFVYIY